MFQCCLVLTFADQGDHKHFRGFRIGPLEFQPLRHGWRILIMPTPQDLRQRWQIPALQCLRRLRLHIGNATYQFSPLMVFFCVRIPSILDSGMDRTGPEEERNGRR